MRGRMKKRHQEIDGDDDNEREAAKTIGGVAWLCSPWRDLCRIECAGGRRALAHDLVLGPVLGVNVSRQSPRPSWRARGSAMPATKAQTPA